MWSYKLFISYILIWFIFINKDLESKGLVTLTISLMSQGLTAVAGTLFATDGKFHSFKLKMLFTTGII